MISQQSETKDSHSYNSGYGYQYEGESSELWVADFGSHEIEQTLREELSKIKPKTPKRLSWILTAIVLLFVIAVCEWSLRVLAQRAFLSEMSTFWLAWLWRLIMLLIWFYVAEFKWLMEQRKFMVVTLSAFVMAVIVSDILKIVYIKYAWTWLNLLVDPIWMIIAVVLLSMMFNKFIYKKNSVKSGK